MTTVSAPWKKAFRDLAAQQGLVPIRAQIPNYLNFRLQSHCKRMRTMNDQDYAVTVAYVIDAGLKVLQSK